jgi:arsenate reductase
MSKTKVLFLCTGNSARSQMAEAFLRQYAGDRFEAHSAGLEPRPIHPFTLRVMEEVGYDLLGHRSKDVCEYLGKHHFGYLITVCSHAEAHCPTAFLGVSQRLHWPIQDPAAFEGSEEETLERFRQARNEIAARIKMWLLELGIPSEGDQDHRLDARDPDRA